MTTKITRNGNWMQTSTGIQFWPIDPRPEEVFIEDIAASLSKQCRFAGHCKRFYSVAEHSVLMARAAPVEFKRAALLHDASEAYLVDVPRPVKSNLVGYSLIETRLMTAIALKFTFAWPLPDEVKHLDEAILAAEKDQAMAREAADWGLTHKPLDVRLQFWVPDRAEAEFLHEFKSLATGG